MGINVSHGANAYGEERRPATTIANLGQQLCNVLPGRDWAKVAHLFDGHVRTPVTVQPRQAREIANILRHAANHRLMPRGWARDAAAFANAAGRAADAREPWTWN